MEPTDYSGLIGRLRQYEGRNHETTLCYNGTRDEAASTISALVAERDEARERADAMERAHEAEMARAIREITTLRPALATAQARIAGLEKALGEFAEPRNWVVNGRFDPHSGNFDATTFARAALTGGEDAAP